MARSKPVKKTLRDIPLTIQKHQEKLAEEVKSIIHQEVQTLFDQFPHIDAIRWTQRLPLEINESDLLGTSEFRIDNVEYRLASCIGRRSVPQGDPALQDCGFDRQDQEWVSPWNDRRVEEASLLDGIANLEEQLFDAEEYLSLALGDHSRVTVTRKDISLESAQ